MLHTHKSSLLLQEIHHSKINTHQLKEEKAKNGKKVFVYV